jgi:hypothetical protein
MRTSMPARNVSTCGCMWESKSARGDTVSVCAALLMAKPAVGRGLGLFRPRSCGGLQPTIPLIGEDGGADRLALASASASASKPMLPTGSLPQIASNPAGLIAMRTIKFARRPSRAAWPSSFRSRQAVRPDRRACPSRRLRAIGLTAWWRKSKVDAIRILAPHTEQLPRRMVAAIIARSRAQ